MARIVVRIVAVSASLAWCVAGSPTAVASGWSVQRTPNVVGEFGSLVGDSCPSATACIAVGSYIAAGYEHTPGHEVALVERWNGRRWSVQPTPNFAPLDAELAGVSCPSENSCIAVGGHETAHGLAALVERWDGRRWSVEPIVGAFVRNLVSVSCSSPSACTAVGGYNTADRTVALRWNGQRWSVQATRNPFGAGSSKLVSVSCASASACTAVGSYNSRAGGTHALVERWNGTRWSVQPIPSPAGAAGGSLAGVSCSSPSACTVVGAFSSILPSGLVRNLALAERWNGKSWSVQPTRNPVASLAGFLAGVSCPSASACTAVGSYTTSGPKLVERWNGKRWSVQPTPSPRGAAYSKLLGVSCSSPSACTAVGSYVNKSGPYVPLVERWSGTS